jgi:uncharacterized membrane protein
MDEGSAGMSLLTTILVVLLAVNTVALVAMTVLYRRAKKASRIRRVEAPNSEYKSEYVMDLEARDRWENVDLGKLHEVNREEFEKILAKVRAASTRSLTTSERDFLDRMADAHDRALREESAGGAHHPRHLHGTS